MQHNIITPVDLNPRPSRHEETIASLLATHQKSDIKFVNRTSTTTPDVLAMRTNQAWEIKSIRGNSKRTIQNNLRRASTQSENVIISLLDPKTRITVAQARGRINEFFSSGPTKIKRLLLITKSSKIIVLK